MRDFIVFIKLRNGKTLSAKNVTTREQAEQAANQLVRDIPPTFGDQMPSDHDPVELVISDPTWKSDHYDYVDGQWVKQLKAIVMFAKPNRFGQTRNNPLRPMKAGWTDDNRPLTAKSRAQAIRVTLKDAGVITTNLRARGYRAEFETVAE